jgi:RNA polymerase primary sigma factor
MEIELAKQVEEGKAAASRLAEFGWESEDERVVMAEKISTGRKAEGRLVLSNLRLVASIANKTRRRFANFSNMSLTFEDLLQEGDIGLMYAIERFDWRKGYRFSTYASYWIRQMIRVSILNTGSMIRIPLSRRDQIMRLKRAETMFEMEQGKKPTVEQLSKIVGMNKDVGRSVYDLSKQDFLPLELDRNLNKNGIEGDTILTRISDTGAPQLQKLEREETLAELFREMRDRLSPEELEAVEMRYGIGGKEQASYKKIAEALDFPSENVAQNRVYGAIQKLKRWTRTKRKDAIGGDFFE